MLLILMLYNMRIRETTPYSQHPHQKPHESSTSFRFDRTSESRMLLVSRRDSKSRLARKAASPPSDSAEASRYKMPDPVSIPFSIDGARKLASGSRHACIVLT